ncbi:hypothetical protein J3A83DRAFT_4369801 [Scleroderma citrinum]
MVARAALLALISVSGAFGFSNTIPFVAWSSQSSDILSSNSPSTRPDHGALLESITNHEYVCSFDAIFVIDHPGLHSSDLRNLQPSCGLAQTIKSAPSSRQLPNVKRSIRSPLHLLEQVASRCGAALLDITPESGEWTLSGEKKHILTMSMPLLEGTAQYRKNVMSQHEKLITAVLEKLAGQTPNHLVVYSGSVLPLAKRQLSDFDPFGEEEEVNTVFNSNAVVAPAGGGILQRYQLLTPALILTLLIVFFVMIPVLLLGISALASIQSPLRTEAPKGYSAHEKKVQ